MSDFHEICRLELRDTSLFRENYPLSIMVKVQNLPTTCISGSSTGPLRKRMTKKEQSDFSHVVFSMMS